VENPGANATKTTQKWGREKRKDNRSIKGKLPERFSRPPVSRWASHSPQAFPFTSQ
jgi:hypothetical protein